MEIIGRILEAIRFEEVMNYSFWDLLVNLILFVLVAFPLFYFIWIYREKKFKPRRIQPKRKTSALGLRREVRNSIQSLVIFTVIDALVYWAQLEGHTKIYTHVSDYGWGYLLLSAVIMIFFHDAYFYFVHRLMHLPKIYPLVHKVHHESVDPSPLATFSFHPLEAIMEASVYVVFAFLLPVHLIALWIWQVVQIVLSVIAHLGYEFYPAGFTRHWLFKYKTPSTHHNMHHARMHGNYGLYFTWWDRILGTEFKDYHQTYDAIHQNVKSATESAAVEDGNASLIPGEKPNPEPLPA